jgi:TonB family protein
MSCKNLYKRLIPFSIAIAVGIFASSFFQTEHFFESNEHTRILYAHKEECEGTEFINCKGEHTHFSPYKESEAEHKELDVSPNRPLKILAQPRAEYTDAGRTNNVNGVVRLHVEFLSSGKIGEIKVVSALPYGLTQQALNAAKHIRFEPKTENGKPVKAARTVEYRFSLY